MNLFDTSSVLSKIRIVCKVCILWLIRHLWARLRTWTSLLRGKQTALELSRWFEQKRLLRTWFHHRLLSLFDIFAGHPENLFFWKPFNKCYGNQFHCYGSWLAFEICAGWWDGKLPKIPRPCGHLRQDRLMVRSCPINYGWRFEDAKAVGSCSRNVRNGVLRFLYFVKTLEFSLCCAFCIPLFKTRSHWFNFFQSWPVCWIKHIKTTRKYWWTIICQSF